MSLFMQVLILAQEAEESSGGVKLILPDIDELIAGIVAFLIVFGFIWFKGRHWISRMLTARQEAVTSQLREAEAAKVEAETLLTERRKEVAGARDEANRIVEESRRSAEAIKADILAKAKSETDESARRAREGIEADRERATEQVRDLVAVLSLELAQKVVAGSVDADAQQTLVDRYIDELEGMPH
ncbi:MAG: atpF [Acidobacteria bacterium]|nr:atpF [Acidobacteriota bacterium]